RSDTWSRALASSSCSIPAARPRRSQGKKGKWGACLMRHCVARRLNVHLSPEAEAYFAKKGCKVLLQPTPEAIHEFNKSHAKKIGLFHVTCLSVPSSLSGNTPSALRR